jgi:hypothetical protein
MGKFNVKSWQIDELTALEVFDAAYYLNGLKRKYERR